MHPVEALLREMHRVEPYPEGVRAMWDRIPGTAFFPGGAGLWGAERVISQNLSPRVSQNLSSTLEARRPFSAYGILSTLSKVFSA
jgi:hypothetical protein